MNSCLYTGTVQHQRRSPRRHRFQYRLWMAYLDLDELPALVGPGKLLAGRKFAAASFLASDHLGAKGEPLSNVVRRTVMAHTGGFTTGPIRLLTLLRSWGYYFSPLNLFYCFDPTGTQVETVLAEVSNTPWNERHLYVLPFESESRPVGGELRYEHPKAFHVSPFMGMQADYLWRLNVPQERLWVEIVSRQHVGADAAASDSATLGGEEFFQASLTLERKPLSRPNLRRALVVNPCVSAKVMGAIYFEALRLWIKRCPYFPHPRSPNLPSAT